MAAVHPTALIGNDVKLGQDAAVGPGCILDGRIAIGPRTRLVGGVVLIGDAMIGADCELEPGVCMTRNWEHDPQSDSPLSIGNGVSIGAGSLISKGLSIGNHARIMPGTRITRHVPPNAIVHGNPAAISGYVDAHAMLPVLPAAAAAREQPPGVIPCAVAGVTLHRFPRIRDLRGDLSVGEFERSVPFQPKRYFLVFDVPSAETRGEHAHKVCKQFMVCTHGSVSVLVDDGRRREEIVLDSPNLGLYVPPMVWGVQYKYSPGAVLLVFASDYYDATDYIRDYGRFVAARGIA